MLAYANDERTSMLSVELNVVPYNCSKTSSGMLSKISSLAFHVVFRLLTILTSF